MISVLLEEFLKLGELQTHSPSPGPLRLYI